jgi:nuclear pore complex protein Nup107
LSSTSQNPDVIPELPEAASSAILEAYIQVLQAHIQPSSVIAFYSSSLDESQAIEAYSRYLFSEYTTADILGTDERATRALDRTERRNALLHTRANGLDLASTARRVVELTLNDIYTELPDFDAATAAFGLLPGQGNDQGTQREQELVRSVEWLTFDPETYPDALRQANALMRYFMCTYTVFVDLPALD